MPRLTIKILSKGITKVGAMDLDEKEKLSDEIFVKQPYLLASVIAQKELGSTLEKIDALLHTLLVAYQATKEAGIELDIITEDDLDKHHEAFVKTIKTVEGLDKESRDILLADTIAQHPEAPLLAYVYNEMKRAGFYDLVEESDRYLILAGVNLADCLTAALHDSR